jgi:hypothetical protein
MANRRQRGICEHCSKNYLKCRFNTHHQKYCTRRTCVAKRRQARQRQDYRQRYRNDKTFAAAERERCRKAMRQRRDHAHRTADQSLTESAPTKINLELLTTGLLSQWLDSNDPLAVEAAARRLESRGRQLAAATLTLGGACRG